MRAPGTPPVAASGGSRRGPATWLRNRLAWGIRTVLSGSATRKFIPPTPGEPTLLPRHGAAWLVHAEASMMVGGIRALLLQSLHPVAMQGVGEHSDFRHDPLERLRRTVFFLGTTTYCSLAQAEAALEKVRQVHEGITGTTPDGRTYRATDPDLLAWVHATEIDSFLEAYLRYGRKPRHSTAASVGTLADEYVAEMAVVAARLGVEAPPRSRAELHATIDGYRPVTAAGDLSTEAAWFLRRFPFPPLTRLVYRMLFRAAVESLPRWANDLHGLHCGRLRRLMVCPPTRLLLAVMGWALEHSPDPPHDAAQAATGGRGSPQAAPVA